MEIAERILIAGSDLKLVKKIYPIFRKQGFIVNTTERASEAIRNVQQEHVSVLVLDVEVKDVAWDEVISIIKELAPSLPIIITSEYNTPELETHILHQKVFFYHVKSFGTEELILAIRNAVEKSKIHK